jgi:2-oxoglutarate ferredoxin oxidoreductase subunit alpha
MNDWVVPQFTWDDAYQPDRGRVLTEEELENLPKFYRYSNEDENYVAARTLPGVHSKGAYVTRGSGHNKLGVYTETPSEYQAVIDRLAQKHKAAARALPAPKIQTTDQPRFGIVTLGGCDLAVREAVEILAERGIPTDFMRICGFPFDTSVEAFLNQHDVNFVIEQNRDAQLRSLITLETGVAKDRLRSVLAYGGFPLSARNVVDGILGQLEK